jgi:phospholipid N-methyltransferase
MSVAESLMFLRSWLRNPRRVGAVAPSGPALARRITAEITPASAPVIELGPGTGAFTQALLLRGVPPDRLVLIEADRAFARALEVRFPTLRILAMDAARLGQIEPPFGDERAGAVVSGLPLLAIPAPAVDAIVAGAFAQLREGGSFYQFTYGPRCPVPRATLDRLGLVAERNGFAVWNLPPASVYRIRRSAG